MSLFFILKNRKKKYNLYTESVTHQSTDFRQKLKKITQKVNINPTHKRVKIRRYEAGSDIFRKRIINKSNVVSFMDVAVEMANARGRHSSYSYIKILYILISHANSSVSRNGFGRVSPHVSFPFVRFFVTKRFPVVLCTKTLPKKRSMLIR